MATKNTTAKKQADKTSTNIQTFKSEGGFPIAVYASVMKSSVTAARNEMFLEFYQQSVNESAFKLVSHIVMPLEAAAELRDLIDRQLKAASSQMKKDDSKKS